MGQVIRCWSDILCSRCYKVLELNRVEPLDGEPVYCSQCGEHVFSIEIMKREYDTTKAIGTNCQGLERDIKHGVEILYIEGEGITELVEDKDIGEIE